MLCDDVAAMVAHRQLADGPDNIKDGFRLYGDWLGQAEKFVLESSVVRAAMDVCHGHRPQFCAALPYARAPFPLTWVELAAADLYADDDQWRRDKTALHRVGALIVSHDNWLKMDFALMYKDRQGTVLPVTYHFSSDESVPDIYRSRLAKGFPVLDDSGKPINDAMLAQGVRNHLMSYPAEHFGGYERVPNDLCVNSARILGSDPWIFIAFFIMLNSRNAVEQTASDLGRLNKARARGGKLPLFEHKVVRMAMRARHRRHAALAGMSHDSYRRHLCGGHFKVRKTGVFWWSPHFRGDAAKGTITKTRIITKVT